MISGIHIPTRNDLSRRSIILGNLKFLALWFIGHGTGMTSDLNFHWMTYQSACQPCSVPFDFVTKIETAEQDSKFILDQMGPQFEHLSPILQKYSSSNMDYGNYVERLKNIYQIVPRDLILKIYGILKLDFEMFGYDIGPFIE